MKKLLLFAATLFAMGTVSSNATVYDVTTGSEFKNVFKNLGLEDESKDTVYIHASEEGCYPGQINCSSGGKNAVCKYETDVDKEGNILDYYYMWDAMANPGQAPHHGKIWFIGVNDEAGNKAVFAPMWYYQNYDTIYNMSLIFDNLDIRDNGGVDNSGKGYIIRGDRSTAYFDSICFRNCDINSTSRYFIWMTPVTQKRYYYTPVDGETYDQTHYPSQIIESKSYYPSGGEIGLFSIDNCTWHNCYHANASSFYEGSHHIGEIDVTNSTFYNLATPTSLFKISNLTDGFDETTVVYVENNCWYVGNGGKGSIISYGDKLAPQSEFWFTNNIFMYPDWTNDFNKERTNTYNLIDAYEAVAHINNNVLDAAVAPIAKIADRTYGDDENPEWGKWYTADTTGNYTPEALELKFSDMLYPENGDFQLLTSSPAYTAGVDGKPVGDPRWYVDKMAAKVNFTASLEGTTVGEITFTPKRAQYYEGDVITLSVKTHGLTTFKGWSDGNTDNPRTYTLGTEDVNLVGTCEDVPYLISYQFEGVASNGSLTTPYAPNYSVVENASMNFLAYIDTLQSYAAQPAMKTRVGKITAGSYCVISKTPIALFDSVVSCPNYFMIGLPTTGYEGLTFSCDLGIDGYASAKYIAQYSLDSINWTTAGSVDMKLDVWNALSAKLPTACEGQQRLFLRVIADPDTKDRVYFDDVEEFTEEFICATNFLVTYTTKAAGIDEVNADAKEVRGMGNFDLQGRPLRNAAEGLQIRNGRVTFIR